MGALASSATAKRVWRALAALALLALGGCNNGSSGSGMLAPGVTNAGLSVVGLQGAGELKLLLVLEAAEGQDLNGDGDTLDEVGIAYDLLDDSRVELGLALGPVLVVGDVLIAMRVPEDAQGQTDLNGDGDTDDSVLFVYDNRTKLATNAGFATAGPAPGIAAGLVAYPVDEFAQGEDLNGDGFLSNLVVQIYDSRTGLSTNSTRVLNSTIVAGEHEFAFATLEGPAGDLNGDGDAGDTKIFQIFDATLGGVVTVPVDTLGFPLAVDEDWYTLVSEAGQGADMNGDGDQNDGVYCVLHPHLGTFQPLGLSSQIGEFSRGNGEWLALVVQEIDGVDRNGDGDELDTLWSVLDPRLGTSFDTGLLWSGFEPRIVGARVAFVVREVEQGADLNGDGDLSDDVVHVVDPVLGEVVNTGLDMLGVLESSATALFFARTEQTNDADWNGDGDELDTLTFVLDPLTGEAHSTGIAGFTHTLGATAQELLLLGSEASEARDLNGDGDSLDWVYVLHTLAGGANRSLALASENFAEGDGLTASGRGALLVDEGAQGADLNGDGDRLDAILHVLE